MDNTNANVGNNNSIKTWITEKNKGCFTAGSYCHQCHLAAGAGAKTFADDFSFEIDEHQVDLYYFFKGNSKRKGIFVEYLDFLNIEWENMTRYVKTRWLSLERFCDKGLHKFSALKLMFLSRVQVGLVDNGRLSGTMVGI